MRHLLTAAVLILAFAAGPARAAGPSWSFDPPAHDFGIQLPETGASAPVPFTLTNTGDVPLSILLTGLGWSSIDVGPPEPELFSIVSNGCGSLDPGEECVIKVAFDPNSAGAKSGQLSVSSGASGVAPAVVHLSGRGAGPVFSITPASLDFGRRDVGAGRSAPQTLTVHNEGQLDLKISKVTIEKFFTGAESQFDLVGGTCTAGLSVPVGSSCTVDVAFVPTLPGSQSTDLRLDDNAPEAPHVATLAGFGVAPPFVFPAPANLNARVALSHRPPRLTTATTAIFRLDGSSTALRFQCKLDARPFVSCETPVRFEGLKPGRHRFAARAFDGNGQLGPIVSRYRWRILRKR